MVLVLVSKSCEAYDPQNGEDYVHLLSIVTSLACDFLPITRENSYVFRLESNMLFFLSQYVQFLHN
jgi:hypothetical protein